MVVLMVAVGDHIRHRPTGRYLGKVTRVGKVAVRFQGPHFVRANGLATLSEVYVSHRHSSSRQDEQR